MGAPTSMTDPITRLRAALAGRYRVERAIGEGEPSVTSAAWAIRGGRAWCLSVYLFLAGCASTAEQDPFGARPAGETTVQVTIENQTFYDVTVWAIWEGGSRERVGDVTALMTRTFTLNPRWDVVRFEGDFLAGPDFVGDPISVFPGDHIDITVPGFR